MKIFLVTCISGEKSIFLFDPNYKIKLEKTYNFCKYTLPIAFLRDIHEGHLSIERADNKRSNFPNESKNFEKGTKSFEKKYFLNNLGLLFSAREKFLERFKSRLFPIKNLIKFQYVNQHQNQQQNQKEQKKQQ